VDTVVPGDSGAALDFTGTYNGAITNRENPCNIGGWTVGTSSTGTMMSITQMGSDISVEVQGFSAFALSLFTGGGGPLVGTATGNVMNVSRSGTRAQTSGACSFTPRIEARATLNGNTLEGTVTYRYQTNGHPDCRERATCATTQSIAFVRPPR
jgi:hypothetical protein